MGSYPEQLHTDIAIIFAMAERAAHDNPAWFLAMAVCEELLRGLECVVARCLASDRLPLADFRHVGPIGMQQRFERERDKTGTINWEKLNLWGRVCYPYLLLWGSKSLKCLWNQKISPQTMNSGRISVPLFVDLFGRWNLQVIWPDTFLLLSSLRLYSMRQYIPGDSSFLDLIIYCSTTNELLYT